DHADQAVILEGLLEKIDRPQFHGLDCKRDVAVPGHDHDWKCAVARFHAFQKLDSVKPGHAHVGNDAPKSKVREDIEKPHGGFEKRDVEVSGIEQEVERISHRLVVVDDVDLSPIRHVSTLV